MHSAGGESVPDAKCDTTIVFWTATNHVNVNATTACALLSHHAEKDKIFTAVERMNAQAFINEWGAKYLIHYRMSSATGAKLTEQLDGQLTDFLVGEGMLKTVNFKERMILKGPMNAWTSVVDGPSELAQVAVALLSVCASEAAVERSFSIQDLVHSKVRNRSGPDMVEAQMFLRMNARLLENINIVSPAAKYHKEPEENLMLPDTDSDGAVHLEYLLVSDPDASVVPPAASAAAAEPDLDISPVEVNDVEESDAEEEKDNSRSVASSSAAHPIIATTAQEDIHLQSFIMQHNIQPNKAGRVTIAGFLEGTLSTEVEAHVPPIRSHLRDLKARLASMCKTLKVAENH
jgi:hypothetical protein